MWIDPTPIMRLTAGRRVASLAQQDPVDAQARVLRRLLAAGRRTRFGVAHGLDQVVDLDGLRRAVPLQTFESLWTRFWAPTYPVVVDATWPGRIPIFALTSGTSVGRLKPVPTTAPMLANHRGAATDLLSCYLRAHPTSRLLAGPGFMLGSAIATRRLAPGVHSGDLSGLARRQVPWRAEPLVFPPRQAAQEGHWHTRLDTLCQLAQGVDVRMIAGMPSWLLLVFERLAAAGGHPPRLVEIFPNLELICHGGMSLAPYRPAFARWMEGSRAVLREAYQATEGFMAWRDTADDGGLRMTLDRGLVFEFLPLDATEDPHAPTMSVAELEPGADYALVVTTCAGLWRYQLGDIVQVVSRQPLRIRVVGRTSDTLSDFGERVTGAEVEQAILAAAKAEGREVAAFTAASVFPGPEGGPGRHRILIELQGAIADPGAAERLAATIDRVLIDLNDTYQEHRADDVQLLAPEVLLLPPGSFREWMRRRGTLGGQNKIPRVLADAEQMALLLAVAAGEGP